MAPRPRGVGRRESVGLGLQPIERIVTGRDGLTLGIGRELLIAVLVVLALCDQAEPVRILDHARHAVQAVVIHRDDVAVRIGLLHPVAALVVLVGSDR